MPATNNKHKSDMQNERSHTIVVLHDPRDLLLHDRANRGTTHPTDKASAADLSARSYARQWCLRHFDRKPLTGHGTDTERTLGGHGTIFLYFFFGKLGGALRRRRWTGERAVQTVDDHHCFRSAAREQYIEKSEHGWSAEATCSTEVLAHTVLRQWLMSRGSDFAIRTPLSQC